VFEVEPSSKVLIGRKSHRAGTEQLEAFVVDQVKSELYARFPAEYKVRIDRPIRKIVLPFGKIRYSLRAIPMSFLSGSLNVYIDVFVNEDKKKKILMTLTSPNCLVAETLPVEVEEKVKSLDEIKDAMRDIDGVFHMASLSLPYCQEYPRSALNVNVIGTFNLLEACIKNNVKKIIFASSSSVYGNAVYSPMDEKHPFEYRDFYAASKLAGEALFRTFYFKYNLAYISLRFMNIYGPRLDYSGAYVAVIMKIIDRLEQDIAPIIYGDGSQSFDFVFVEDACRSLILAMISSRTCNTYNISSGKQISILDLCKRIQKIMNNNIPIEFKSKDDKYLVTNSRIGSTKKAKDDLGFEVDVLLENGLKQVIDWKLSQSAQLK
jgi:UDP-glucose 4-epimerase